MSFFDYLKNAFILIIFLQIAPSFFKGIGKQYRRYLFPRTRFGLIEVKGVVYNSDRYNKYLKKYFEDETIKAILLKMECPGGASGTAHAIFNEIVKLKQKYPTKPIVTLIENLCASGGYYIAAATDSIISPATALIGNIGAQLPYLFQLQKFLEEYKISYEPIKAGKYKTSVDPFITITDDDKQMLQSVVDNLYAQFMQDIVKTRKLSLNDKDKWAEGKLFTGKQAHALGLIDTIGSASDAVSIMREEAMVEKNQKIEWVRPVQKTSLWSLFSGREQNGESGSMFSAFANQLCDTVENRYLARKAF